MKNSTERILNYFPMFKKNLTLALENETSVDLSSFSDIERTFFSLALFFERPKTCSFDYLGMLYTHLDNEWLELALELVTDYFQKDTFLIQKPSFSIIKEEDHYLNSSQFADYLCENGLKYDRAKVKNYYDRGKLPRADLTIAGVNYWKKESVVSYCKEELARLNK
ncbi:hypothetical protein [Bacillus xiapuensis]|uniref:Uncharacterized protein n=1 Tax=Bacillus xiapuensis TaxID=2014075 RepID=A0ABU6N8H3_9BACI|nr:hypothetical protein [Bacillus xiapuensis]